MPYSTQQRESLIRFVLNRIKDIFWRDDMDPLEVGVAFMTLAFSIQLLNPFYDTFTTTISFTVMRDLASEQWWGFLGLAIGTTDILSLLFQWKIVRIFTSLTLTGYILFLAALFGLTNPQGTGVVTYGVWAVLMFIVTLRAAKDAG